MTDSVEASINKHLVMHMVEAATATLEEVVIVQSMLSRGTDEEQSVTFTHRKGLIGLLGVLTQARLLRVPYLTDERALVALENTIKNEHALDALLIYTSDFYDRLACIDAGYTVDRACAMLAEILSAKYCMVSDKMKLDSVSLSMIVQDAEKVRTILLSNNWLVFIYASILASDFWSKFHGKD